MVCPDWAPEILCESNLPIPLVSQSAADSVCVCTGHVPLRGHRYRVTHPGLMLEASSLQRGHIDRALFGSTTLSDSETRVLHKKELKKKLKCIKGESNPRRVDGNDPGYHYPINASK